MIFGAWRHQALPGLGVVLALGGLLSSRYSLLATGLFFWGLALLSAYLARRTLSHMTVATMLTAEHAEIGEAVPTEMIVQNPLPWPILDVQWKVDLPQPLTPEGPGTVVQAPSAVRQTLSGILWVGSRQRIRIQYTLTGSVRGRWNIGPGSLIFHDPLMWNELVRTDDTQLSLTVWPRRYALPRHFWSHVADAGPIKGAPWDPPDPFRIINIRPYQPGDPIRLIAPYPSARSAQLMVRQLEPTATRSVEVLLHPKTTEMHWHGIDRALLEEAVSAAASVADSAVAAGLVTGLSSTGAIPGHIRGFTLPAVQRTYPDDLLTALAWVQPSGTMEDDLGHVLARLGPRLNYRTTLVIVTPYWADEFTRQLESRVKRGLQVILIKVGDVAMELPSWIREIWRNSEGEWSRA